MNRSGAAIGRLLQEPEFQPAEHLLIVVDDIALPIGRARIRARGSAGGHNGLKSVEAVLRSQEYPRLRIGVAEPPPGIDRADWVLGTFAKDEETEVRNLLPKLADVTATWLTSGVDEASRRLGTDKTD
jgi:peptidyl-tRNA hydrolase, PTH1 family